MKEIELTKLEKELLDKQNTLFTELWNGIFAEFKATNEMQAKNEATMMLFKVAQARNTLFALYQDDKNRNALLSAQRKYSEACHTDKATLGEINFGYSEHSITFQLFIALQAANIQHKSIERQGNDNDKTIAAIRKNYQFTYLGDFLRDIITLEPSLLIELDQQGLPLFFQLLALGDNVIASYFIPLIEFGDITKEITLKDENNGVEPSAPQKYDIFSYIDYCSNETQSNYSIYGAMLLTAIQKNNEGKVEGSQKSDLYRYAKSKYELIKNNPKLKEKYDTSLFEVVCSKFDTMCKVESKVSTDDLNIFYQLCAECDNDILTRIASKIINHKTVAILFKPVPSRLKDQQSHFLQRLIEYKDVNDNDLWHVLTKHPVENLEAFAKITAPIKKFQLNRNSQKQTPLTMAVNANNLPALKVILNYLPKDGGADPIKEAFTLAQEAKKTKVMSFLLNELITSANPDQIFFPDRYENNNNTPNVNIFDDILTLESLGEDITLQWLQVSEKLIAALGAIRTRTGINLSEDEVSALNYYYHSLDKIRNKIDAIAPFIDKILEADHFTGKPNEGADIVGNHLHEFMKKTFGINEGVFNDALKKCFARSLDRRCTIMYLLTSDDISCIKDESTQTITRFKLSAENIREFIKLAYPRKIIDLSFDDKMSCPIKTILTFITSDILINELLKEPVCNITQWPNLLDVLLSTQMNSQGKTNLQLLLEAKKSPARTDLLTYLLTGKKITDDTYKKKVIAALTFVIDKDKKFMPFDLLEKDEFKKQIPYILLNQVVLEAKTIKENLTKPQTLPQDKTPAAEVKVGNQPKQSKPTTTDTKHTSKGKKKANNVTHANNAPASEPAPASETATKDTPIKNVSQHDAAKEVNRDGNNLAHASVPNETKASNDAIAHENPSQNPATKKTKTKSGKQKKKTNTENSQTTGVKAEAPSVKPEPTVTQETPVNLEFEAFDINVPATKDTKSDTTSAPSKAKKPLQQVTQTLKAKKVVTFSNNVTVHDIDDSNKWICNDQTFIASLNEKLGESDKQSHDTFPLPSTPFSVYGIPKDFVIHSKLDLLRKLYDAAVISAQSKIHGLKLPLGKPWLVGSYATFTLLQGVARKDSLEEIEKHMDDIDTVIDLPLDNLEEMILKHNKAITPNHPDYIYLTKTKGCLTLSFNPQNGCSLLKIDVVSEDKIDLDKKESNITKIFIDPYDKNILGKAEDIKDVFHAVLKPNTAFKHSVLNGLRFIRQKHKFNAIDLIFSKDTANTILDPAHSYLASKTSNNFHYSVFNQLKKTLAICGVSDALRYFSRWHFFDKLLIEKDKSLYSQLLIVAENSNACLASDVGAQHFYRSFIKPIVTCINSCISNEKVSPQFLATDPKLIKALKVLAKKTDNFTKMDKNIAESCEAMLALALMIGVDIQSILHNPLMAIDKPKSMLHQFGQFRGEKEATEKSISKKGVQQPLAKTSSLLATIKKITPDEEEAKVNEKNSQRVSKQRVRK